MAFDLMFIYFFIFWTDGSSLVRFNGESYVTYMKVCGTSLASACVQLIVLYVNTFFILILLFYCYLCILFTQIISKKNNNYIYCCRKTLHTSVSWLEDELAFLKRYVARKSRIVFKSRIANSDYWGFLK